MTITKPTYKDCLIRSNTELSNDKKTIFVGYGLKKGRALGTLVNVDANMIIEMPVAENLMVGFAIGLSLKGFKPVVFIERMDFLLNSLDAIVNHLDKIKIKSQGEFKPAIIIRCIVGNKNKPLYTGITHTQDFSKALKYMVSFPVINLIDKKQIIPAYKIAYKNLSKGISSILVEYKDFV